MMLVSFKKAYDKKAFETNNCPVIGIKNIELLSLKVSPWTRIFKILSLELSLKDSKK
jgi:hypothetical protein